MRALEEEAKIVTRPLPLLRIFSIGKVVDGRKCSVQIISPFVLCWVPLWKSNDREMSVIIKGLANTLTCNSRIAPGSTVTSAAAIEVEILNIVESIIFAEPPAYLVSFTFDHAKEKGSGTSP